MRGRIAAASVARGRRCSPLAACRRRRLRGGGGGEAQRSGGGLRREASGARHATGAVRADPGLAPLLQRPHRPRHHRGAGRLRADAQAAVAHGTSRPDHAVRQRARAATPLGALRLPGAMCIRTPKCHWTGVLAGLAPALCRDRLRCRSCASAPSGHQAKRPRAEVDRPWSIRAGQSDESQEVRHHPVQPPHLLLRHGSEPLRGVARLDLHLFTAAL
mmetsp:Transcript_41510/g.129092  ORF Transcript_41510/g.129092 Transcript_41510/m.129092 type:complete len:217 (+) Transcript_41510:457-1107(+)